VNSAAEGERRALGERWQTLADLWRAKQLQYTWLRSLAGQHADFWQVTGEALDFSLETLGLEDPGLRRRLMDLYLTLSAYPEVAKTLSQLKSAGTKLAILSNGSPRMLLAAVENAGLSKLLDQVISVEEVGIFKPHPSVYQMAVDRFALEPGEICFVSSNGWDAYSARAFGLRVVWCNRFGQSPERIPAPPDSEIAELSPLPGILGS
jgi:2-haloacid dehalogenase